MNNTARTKTPREASTLTDDCFPFLDLPDNVRLRVYELTGWTTGWGAVSPSMFIDHFDVFWAPSYSFDPRSKRHNWVLRRCESLLSIPILRPPPTLSHLPHPHIISDTGQASLATLGS